MNLSNIKYPLSAGFEPAREDPNGFLVHRLNHSATTTLFQGNYDASQKLSQFTIASIVNLALHNSDIWIITIYFMHLNVEFLTLGHDNPVP